MSLHLNAVLERPVNDMPFAVYKRNANNEQESVACFSVYHSQHSNIKVTMEREVDQEGPFLHVPIDNSNPLFLITSVFRFP